MSVFYYFSAVIVAKFFKKTLIHYLKIDKIFVYDIMDDENDANIVKTNHSHRVQFGGC